MNTPASTLGRQAFARAPSAFLLSALLWLPGCGESGVPEVANPHAIVVDGKPMNPSEFLGKYCRDKVAEKTCLAVRDAKSHDEANRPMPKNW